MYPVGQERYRPSALASSPPSFPAQGPVDWALGKVLIETALKPLLYSVLPDRVDPRDWMRPKLLELQLAAIPTSGSQNHEDYWFDFVADTGDSDVGAYAISYLFHGDLRVDGLADVSSDRPQLERPLAVVAGTAEHAAGALPRGQFLYVGGDSAYPVAETKQLLERFVRPMNHAWEQRFPEAKPDPRPLLGIPGNHDWYDNLDGFGRTFRQPAPAGPTPSKDTSEPLLPLGHEAVQEASYFVLPLPGKWQLWALDARDGADLDHRQRAYLHEQAKSLSAADGARSVLLATPNPAFVNGSPASWLGELCKCLPPATLERLALWFSGDTHHYARYQQVPVPGASPITSLVSGLGGAALHSPLAGGKSAEVLYPSVSEGAGAVLRRLLSPWYMIQRRGLNLLGLVLGVCLGASSFARSNARPGVPSEVEQVFSVPNPIDSQPEQRAVWLATFAAIVWLVFKLLKAKPSEKEARKRSIGHRLLGFAAPLLLLGFGLVLAAQGERSFGRVLLDFLFALATLALLGVIPLLLATGLPKPRRSFLRVASLVLVAAVLGALTIGGSVVVARAAALGLHGTCLGSLPCRAAGALLPPLAAAVAQFCVFPVLAGLVLAFAFWCGTQRAFVSSFASVDRYLAFIRFRLRVDKRTGRGTLTGFVIAVSQGVSRDTLRAPKSRTELEPRAELIDIFTVEPADAG